MKLRFTLKFMLKATAVYVLLTCLWYVDTGLLPYSHLDYFREFELICAWIILLVGWAVYFVDLHRMRKKDKERK